MTLRGNILALSAVAALAACATSQTTADYDRGAEFSHYTTFAWKDVYPSRDELV